MLAALGFLPIAMNWIMDDDGGSDMERRRHRARGGSEGGSEHGEGVMTGEGE